MVKMNEEYKEKLNEFILKQVNNLFQDGYIFKKLSTNIL